MEMNLTQFCACLLFEASLGIPMPEFWRHTAARKDLMRSLRAEKKSCMFLEAE